MHRVFSILIIALILYYCQCRPQIVYQSSEYSSNGYKFQYETEDGQKREEAGVIEVKGQNDSVLHVRGMYSYIGTDGRNYIVFYQADEQGYRTEEDIVSSEISTDSPPTITTPRPPLPPPASPINPAAIATLAGGGLG